ncbi:prepilin-type N-terminal cleavage/methylation domain-containing protein [Pseudoxanthomonas suwonensis]|jgi:prepilin-type N-terminal cleavage/methylation domain|uniref:prepilin-type N-terminal cleavage/methylation domain-containing protein n=1 Tax=Pseudoxanthomonas suwonensis TaxID=314722 RepID=UPI0004666560|nr:prepilin-type N-terminal cleavage/methylation domain-containing protein [Pseudoxanthomonas suwonensis]
MTRRSRATGFTLLEMIVVLVITGMAVALSFQALGQWMRAERAIAESGASMRETVLAESWVRDSLRGLVPAEDPVFSGGSDRIAGVTLAPLLSDQGGFTPVEWQVEVDANGGWLRLEERGHSVRLPLPDAAGARFSYFDQEGKVHEQWPPALGLHEQLPAAIALTLETDGAPARVWLAAPAGERNPSPQYFQDDAY